MRPPKRPLPARAHVAAALAATLGGVLALAGCTASVPAAAVDPTIAVSVDQCGTGWTDPAPGAWHFTLHNTDARAGEVYLTDAASGAVYAEVDQLAAGTTAPMTITLGAGRYAFRCAMEDEQTVVGPTVTVTGGPATSPGPVAAVAQADLLQATRRYQGYVTGQLPRLLALAQTVQRDVDRGDLAAARRAWLPAHLQYERLGAAYGAFGPLDAAVNGLPNGLPQGVADPGWTGFHRLEYGLWHGQDAAALRPVAARLVTDIGRLRTTLAHTQIDPLTFSLRAHEITENALQFELTGRTDFGSGTNLQTIAANLDGTTTVLGILRPLLASREPQLPQTVALLAEAGQDAATLPPLAKLTVAQREKIDAQISQLAEDLAPVASILEPRRVSQ